MKLILSNQRGNGTIIAAIAGSVIAAVAMVAIMQTMSSTVKMQKHVELRDDLDSIRKHVRTALDCTQTLATGRLVNTTVFTPLNIAAGNDCIPGSAAYKLLLLRDRNNAALTQPLSPLADVFQNTGQLGSWQLLSQCDRVNQTLVIRAVRATPQRTFASDPMTKRTYDFTANESLYLFGGPTGVKICQKELGGVAPGCPPGQVMTNYDGNAPTCRDLGTGTVGYIPMWLTPDKLGDSKMFQTPANFIGFNTATPDVRFHFNITNQLLKFKGGNAAEISLEGSRTGPGTNTASFEFINNATGTWWHQTLRGDTRNLEFHYRPAGTTGIENRTAALPTYIFRMVATGANAGKIESATGFATTSDRREKDDIQPLEPDMKEKLRDVRGVSFLWKKNPGAGRQLGFIAQEVEKIYPELVTEDSTGRKKLDYDGFLPIVVEAIRDLESRCESAAQVKQELRDVQDELAKLRSEIKKLQGS